MNADQPAAGEPFQPIDRELLTQLLTELDAALAGKPHVSLLVVGGAAMMQLVSHRESADVDVAHPDLNVHIMIAAAEIAERHRVAPDWLNAMFRLAYPEAADALAKLRSTVIYEGPNLTVEMPPVEALMLLKLMAGRPQDIDDLADLMVLEAPERTPEEWVRHFEARARAGLTDEERTGVREAAHRARRIDATRNQPPTERNLPTNPTTGSQGLQD